MLEVSVHPKENFQAVDKPSQSKGSRSLSIPTLQVLLPMPTWYLQKTTSENKEPTGTCTAGSDLMLGPYPIPLLTHNTICLDFGSWNLMLKSQS